MTPSIATELAARFRRAFGVEPRLFRAPGRVNLIGEHTDYNDGFVLPAALDLATYVAIAPRPNRRLRVQSAAFPEPATLDLNMSAPSPRRDWTDYVFGVAFQLERAGHRLTGADVMIDGDLPMGAGLSASAALEVSVGYALANLSGVAIDKTELATLCQRAENEFVGMRCGVMDQLISCHAIEGGALLIDCRTLNFRPIKIDSRAKLVVCDTMARHQLASSEYNLRRRDCESAVALLSGRLPGVNAIRDVTMDQLVEHRALLPPVVFRRARHVVGENDRTLRAADALEAGDIVECGRLMNLSHASLRDDYEVSCQELDLMVDLAQHAPGVFGSRMTGGGFGGCTINLVATEATDAFVESVGAAYRDATGLTPSIFCCDPGPGVGPVAL